MLKKTKRENKKLKRIIETYETKVKSNEEK